VHLNQEDVDARRIPEAAQILVIELARLGVVFERTIFRNSQIPSGQIEIKVGG
jgi:hypothetical protein